MSARHAPPAAAPADPMERVRVRLRALPRAELERRLLGVVAFLGAPDDDVNGGDLVSFLGDLVRDVTA